MSIQMGLNSHINTLLNSQKKIYPQFCDPLFLRESGEHRVWRRSPWGVMFSRLSFKDCNCLLGKNICYKQVGSEIKQSQIKSDTSHERLNFRKERKGKCFLLEKRKNKNLHKCFKNCMWQVEVSSPKKVQVKLHLYPESLSESEEDTKQRPLKTRMTLLTPSPSVPSHYTQPSCEITALPGTEGTAPFTSFIPWTEPRLLENMLRQSEDMWTELCATETEHSFSGEDTIRGQSSQIDV